MGIKGKLAKIWALRDVISYKAISKNPVKSQIKVLNYLIKNGYPTSEIKDPKEVYDSIFSYNHSDNYVRVVLELRNEIEKELSLN